MGGYAVSTVSLPVLAALAETPKTGVCLLDRREKLVGVCRLRWLRTWLCLQLRFWCGVRLRSDCVRLSSLVRFRSGPVLVEKRSHHPQRIHFFLQSLQVGFLLNQNLANVFHWYLWHIGIRIWGSSESLSVLPLSLKRINPCDGAVQNRRRQTPNGFNNLAHPMVHPIH